VFGTTGRNADSPQEQGDAQLTQDMGEAGQKKKHSRERDQQVSTYLRLSTRKQRKEKTKDHEKKKARIEPLRFIKGRNKQTTGRGRGRKKKANQGGGSPTQTPGEQKG